MGVKSVWHGIAHVKCCKENREEVHTGVGRDRLLGRHRLETEEPSTYMACRPPLNNAPSGYKHGGWESRNNTVWKYGIPTASMPTEWPFLVATSFVCHCSSKRPS